MSFASLPIGKVRASGWLGVSRKRASSARYSAVVASHQDVLGFIDASGEVGRAAVVWMQFLHQVSVRPRYLVRRRAFLEAKYLIGLVLGNRIAPARLASGARSPAAPRVLLTLSCATPSGKAAVEISL